MDYQRLEYETVQAAYDRISLIEWFIRNNEATDSEVGELVRLKKLVEGL